MVTRFGRELSIALISDRVSFDEDYDSSSIMLSLEVLGIKSEVVFWDETLPSEMVIFDFAIVRSPWSYFHKFSDFSTWIQKVDSYIQIANPAVALFWSMNKSYIIDLSKRSIPTIPSVMCSSIQEVREALGDPRISERVVIKPAIGAYSHGVRCFEIGDTRLFDHCNSLFSSSSGSVILQPFVESLRDEGEINLIFFNGSFSHAVKKPPLIDLETGIAGSPTQDRRQSWTVGDDAIKVASKSLVVAAEICGLEMGDLLYSRVDIMRRDDGLWAIHEIELCEPSLSLNFFDGASSNFANAIVKYLERIL